MRVSREQAAANRERIIDAAAALFRAKGFSGIGVADIMKAADLTHGGFYGHFTSKDDLVAQASRRTMARRRQTGRRVVAEAPDDPYAALLQHYLTPRHRDEPGHGCGFAALCNDAARSGKTVRNAFAEGLEPLIDILAQSMPGRTKADPPAQSGRRHGCAGGRGVARPRRRRPGVVGRNYRRREARAVGGRGALEHYSLTVARPGPLFPKCS